MKKLNPYLYDELRNIYGWNDEEINIAGRRLLNQKSKLSEMAIAREIDYILSMARNNEKPEVEMISTKEQLEEVCREERQLQHQLDEIYQEKQHLMADLLCPIISKLPWVEGRRPFNLIVEGLSREIHEQIFNIWRHEAHCCIEIDGGYFSVDDGEFCLSFTTEEDLLKFISNYPALKETWRNVLEAKQNKLRKSLAKETEELASVTAHLINLDK